MCSQHLGELLWKMLPAMVAMATALAPRVSRRVAVIGGGLRSLLRIFIGALLFIQWLLLG